VPEERIKRHSWKGTDVKVAISWNTILNDLCIIGPISPPSEEYRYILTTIDMCTRFPEAVPLKDISASTVAEALLEIFSRVGLPYKAHSDRGSQFTSEMIREVYRLLDVKQSTTLPTMQWEMALLRISIRPSRIY